MNWGHLEIAEHREWLVTDGRGGYASGTVSGVLTRRYHGLLVASLHPPLDRRVLWTKLDAIATYRGRSFALGANRWHDGTIAPDGYRYVTSFALDGRVPVWQFSFEDVVLEARVWMDGEGSTFVDYTVRSASAPLHLELKAYVEDRDFHTLTHAYAAGSAVTIDERNATIRMSSGTTWYLACDTGTMEAAGEWYYGVRYAAESERELDDLGDVYHAATVTCTLGPSQSITLVGALHRLAAIDGASSRERIRRREADLVRAWRAQQHAVAAPSWIETLVLAADQCIAARTNGSTVVAGYHWFGDWGRDTMIALPGLTLATGRPNIARSILATFARYVDGGMIPNRFPDTGEQPEYNTIDASLWFIEATRAYHAATHDDALLGELIDALESIIDAYEHGTRYGIGVDPNDGLVRGGESGVQLTWMDAKVGDWVVTPRIGKPVEVNALWYNALRAMEGFAQRLGRDTSRYSLLAARVRQSFARYWNDDTRYLYDVLDGPDGDDASIRPNAVFAAALPFRPIDNRQERAIVERASQALLTPFGLRSLAYDDAAYCGRYAGPPHDRDAAYHRGTVWPWLIGPFVRAWVNAHGTTSGAERFLEPFADRLDTYGMGTLAEIADGDAPHDARGCIAQAWSIAEVLHTWHELHRSTS